MLGVSGYKTEKYNLFLFLLYTGSVGSPAATYISVVRDIAWFIFSACIISADLKFS
jgi:hypothetical protein